MKSKVGGEDGPKKKKQKKKKDPNAPKKAISGFMFFSQSEREVSIYADTDLIFMLFFLGIKQIILRFC